VQKPLGFDVQLDRHSPGQPLLSGGWGCKLHEAQVVHHMEITGEFPKCSSTSSAAHIYDFATLAKFTLAQRNNPKSIGIQIHFAAHSLTISMRQPAQQAKVVTPSVAYDMLSKTSV